MEEPFSDRLTKTDPGKWESFKHLIINELLAAALVHVLGFYFLDQGIPEMRLLVKHKPALHKPQ